MAQPIRKETQNVAVEPEVLLPIQILTAREMKKILKRMKRKKKAKRKNALTALVLIKT